MTALILRHLPFIRSFVLNLAWLAFIYVVFTGVIALVEWRIGKSVGRYFSRAHLQHLAWYFVRHGTVYPLLVFSWMWYLTGHYLGFLNLHLVDHAPFAIRFLTAFLAGEFVFYWMHRLRHSVPLLWTFHATHHSCEQMTPASMDTIHLVDDYVINSGMILVSMVIGTEPRIWFAVSLLRSFSLYIQHSELDWSFGPFYNIFVSPAFHRVHHAKAREFRDSNFGASLSLWDYVFGTAVKPAVVPSEYGVHGLSMPTLASQVLGPFRTAWTMYFPGRRAGVNAAQVEAGAPEAG